MSSIIIPVSMSKGEQAVDQFDGNWNGASPNKPFYSLLRSLTITASLALTLLLPSVSRADSLLTVINVHAWDCPPCIRWHNVYKKDWLESREYKLVRYVEIDSPTIRQAYNPKYWPNDLQPVLRQTAGRGVPRYLIVKDGKVVSDQYDVNHWPHTLADLRKLLAASASAPISAPAAPALAAASD